MPIKFLALGVGLLLITSCFYSQQEVIIIEKSTNLENIKKISKKINRWSMPVEGNISKTFSIKNEHLGLTFDTNTGKNVRTIRNGKVVYAGNKIKNHGKMIIIRHPFGFYSSYTQNKTLMVKNGDSVTKGQIIAITSKVPFYFEMKKFQQPINPLKYLKIN
ncbi:MAG: M23 family metallopeptidase [Candidatus Vesicomyosocius endoextente]|uniref:M23 family metallopeptidase n=1 Tax=Candidatus Vesicomyosocius endoextente TaxID=2738853 RepID=A0A853G7C9_9GAMM|nr:M23 family metallopeptidase [Candidatus Vesicomyosocius endoextente]